MRLLILLGEVSKRVAVRNRLSRLATPLRLRVVLCAWFTLGGSYLGNTILGSRGGGIVGGGEICNGVL
jgi:hypothetical protein